MKYGSVNSIETLGLFDGPGVRVVVFLNSCKLRCKFCHNPEMWAEGNLNYNSIDLANKIKRYKPYFKDSGGVTFSGGEPLLQSDFLTEVVEVLKKDNIDVALDTSGVGYNYDKLLELVDLVIFDIKHIDESEYYQLTGGSIETSLKFISKCNELNKKMWIRQVIIPGVNDNKEYVDKLKIFINGINNVEKVEFLPFHKLGNEKYDKLDITNPYQSVDAMDKDVCNDLYEYFKRMD